MKVAALCAGYGGLELALGDVWPDAHLSWVAEMDPHASQVLEHRFGVPNHGDLTAITDPPPVDVVTAGFPCQPFSTAGLRQGVNDDRWLIDDVCRVASAAGASTLILENVTGLLTANDGDALARVCAAMASQGFRRWEWTTLRAGDVGAPHRRDRWFCVAYSGSVGRRPWPRSGTGEPAEVRRHGSSNNRGAPAAHADDVGQLRDPKRLHRSQPAPDATRGGATDRFGTYQPAVDRWADLTGRTAPEPLTDGRLSPRFTEWMMGLPDGWVTDIVTNRRHSLRILGNGVVPQQAAAAIRELVDETHHEACDLEHETNVRCGA